MTKFLLFTCAALFLIGCSASATFEPISPPPPPTATLALLATSTRLPEPTGTPTAPPTAATAPLSVGPTATVFPTPFDGQLTLRSREILPVTCEFDPSAFPSVGMEFLAYARTGECQNGELGLFSMGEKTYVAQSGLFDSAFTLTEVTEPTAPQVLGVWDIPPQTLVMDLKPFRQDGRHFLALGLQRSMEPGVPCGVLVVEVTDVTQPEIVMRLDGRTTGAPEPWCSVHTLEIDTDADGNATFIIVSDVDTYSARAVDIRDLENPRETNYYHLHVHPHALPEQPVINYVHDSFVSEDKVYLANWQAGVVILDKAKFEAGVPQEAVIIKPTVNVAPGGFRVHYVAPIPNTSLIFIEDELNADNGLRLLDITDPANPKTLWTYTNPGGVNAPHNFVIRDDKIYVGWYNDGVKVFQFDISDPVEPQVELVAVHPVRNNAAVTRERYFDGIWGVRVNNCFVRGIKRICVYGSDMSTGLIILAMDES